MFEDLYKILWEIRKKIHYTNSLNILIKIIDPQMEVKKASIPLEIKKLEYEDIGKYCEARASNTQEDTIKRLNNGWMCECAYSEGKIVAYFWRALNEAEIPELGGHKINLPPDCYYGCNAFTHPDYRRLGIFTELMTTTNPKATQYGLRYSISLIDITNVASLNADLKTGSKIIGVIDHSIILGLNFYKLKIVVPEYGALINEIFNI